MQLTDEDLFGPFRNGVQYAERSLARFLKEVHANWSDESRDALKDGQTLLINQPQPTFSQMLQELRLDPDAQRRVSRLKAYLPLLKDVEDRPFGTVIEGLRTALPLRDAYMYPGYSLRIMDLRHNIPQWAALAALYELLLHTNYWQERGILWANRAFDPDTLGLLVDRELNPEKVKLQMEAFREELNVREGDRYSFLPRDMNVNRFGFHPLDVMARLFDPYYFERLLNMSLVKLPNPM